MVRLEIDGKSVESILESLSKDVIQLNIVNRSLIEELSRTNEKITTLSYKINDLQNQIIDMKKEDTKERTSLWDFLKGAKTSRIKKSTIVVDK